MPLLGKIVVIKRNGGDGTEFPLTASCLFGRKLDCDIRIQLPQVSKEHCKIELNENKELILTNLSSVNPTRINGQVFNQSERLKHGDLITIIDRSFRFEYPPPKTPKKRLSTAGKDKSIQPLQDQHDKSTPIHAEKRKSEQSFDTCLKDGSNLPPSVEQSVETEPEDGKIKKDSMSPFCELYQMVKQDLAAKSPWKSELPKTPLARPRVDHKEAPTEDVKSSSEPVTTPSTKKRRSSKYSSEEVSQSSFNANQEEKPAADDDIPSLKEKSVTPVSQKKRTPLKTPQKFSAGDVVQQILLQPQPEEKTPKSTKGRRSGGSQDQSLDLPMPSGQPQTPGLVGKNTEVKMSPRTSPRSNAGKRFQVQDVLHEIKATTSASKNKEGTSVTEVTVSKSKRKRVSFGGQLSPELFDKRLPPNSPLRRGATPRRSLGPSQKPQSLLRRASTIGLLALRLKETVPHVKNSSPKKASPKRAASAAKTPSPAKRSPSTKAKTPSPKHQKSPAPLKVATPSSISATPKTPASARRASISAAGSLGDMSVTETPKVQGRFSVSRISTPSPVQDQGEQSEVQSTIVEDIPEKCVTPKIPLRRKSMKSSARKTPKSAIKSALDVIRSRRSGASRANLKVLTSWADIVKFGQTKPQTEVAAKKKPTKSNIVKRTAVPKPRTPARRLKDDISTGHAASPATIVVGKAHMRTNQSCGAAPKIVPNVALFKKDMKMDEDFTGVADIFKTPANSRSKNKVPINNECPEMPLDEISVMKTPEESGEMIVSPLSVFSTAKCGQYNNEAVTRLLLDDKDGSLLEDEGLSQLNANSNEASCHDIIPDQEMPSSDQTLEEEATPQTVVKTPKQKVAPSMCLTGVKRLMKTPKQRAEPIEDLRGKLLKTPKEHKPPQEESLEGVKELLKTPKYRGAPVEDMVGVKRVMQTPKVKSNPVLCAAGLQRLMKTPKENSEQHEELTDVKELIQTPKLKGDLEENQFGLKRLVKIAKQKRNQVEEDLTGVQQLMKTPKHKGEPVEDDMCIQRLMQTPKEKVEPVEELQIPKQNAESFSNGGMMAKEVTTGFKELEEPDSNSTLTTENDVIEPTVEPIEIQEPVLAVESSSALMSAKDSDEECDKENVCPVETMETEVDSQCTIVGVDSIHCEVETDDVIPQEKHPDMIEEEYVSVEAIDVCFSGTDEKYEEQSEETVCTSDNSNATVETTSTSSTAEEDEEDIINASLGTTIQGGSRGRATPKSKNANNDDTKLPAVLSVTEEENMNGSLPTSPPRARRGKKILELPEVVASPVRKSARGRIPKHRFVEEDAKNTEASQVSVDSMKTTEIPECLPVVTKTRRGRKAKQDEAVIEPVDDINSGDPQCPDAPENEELVQAPVVIPERRKKLNRTASHPSEEVEQKTPEIVCELEHSTRARRGKQANKEHLKTQPTPTLENEITSTHAAVVAEKPLTPIAKSGRGRKAKKEIVREQLLDNDYAMVVSQTVAEVNADHKDESEAPAVKSGRGRKAKQQKPQIAEEVDDQPAVDANTPVPEEHTVAEVNVDHKDEAEEPVAKSGRGRKAKQQKPQIAEEVDDQPAVDASTHAPVTEEHTVAEVNVDHKDEAEAPVAKSGRGRKAKQQKPQISEEVDDQPAVDASTHAPVTEEHTVAEVNVDHKDEPEVPVVKSGRGRKAKQQKPQIAEEVDDQPAVDASTHAPVTEEQTATEVKSVRGSRRTKQSKVTFSVETKENVVNLVEQAETPVVKSGRKRATVTKEAEVEAEVSVKRGRRAVAEPAPPVAMVSSRGRKAVAKVESEVTKDSASSEEPAKAVKHTRRTTKVPESKKEENPLIQGGSELVAAENTAVVALEKVERGSRGRKQKDSAKPIPKDLIDDISKAKEASETKPSKDLVVEEQQLKKSKRFGKISAETPSTLNQSTCLPPRGRRGAKREEHPVEEVQIIIKPLRRGKAVAAAPKSDPSNSKPSTPLKRKRNDVLEATDESSKNEPLPKKRGRVAITTKVAIEVPSKEKMPDAGPEKAEANPKKAGNRVVRGQKKTTQEPDPTPAQESVSGTTTRRGRSVKKVEEVVISTEAAPVRRTRRK